ncbi:MAG: glyceraldehyde 3-phosphate dehydrogenase, glyceraldehyde 3-phosphate dehydrogenase [Candidatus Parcubacteria bacterium]|jgi:glyceraldehyde 3-phosphate dehydrogenase
MKKVAINGFGRIGRAFLKLTLTNPEAMKDIEIVAINDLGDLDNMIYLLNHDSVYRQKIFKKVESKITNQSEKYLVLETLSGIKKEIRFISIKDTNQFIQDKVWQNLGIDIVVECTGLFVSADKSHFHIESGAKRVVISAPTKDEKNSMHHSETVLMGINEEKLKDVEITSNASCTTNSASPIIAILDEAVGIEKAILNTVHSYTASQSIVDGPNKKDWREGRAGAQNIVPSTTGAAIAVTKAFVKLEGLFDGISLRVPSIAGSIADITFISKRNTSVEEINRILENASHSVRWKNIFAVSNEELVSTDILGLKFASIADLKMTKVVGGNLVKVLTWYDNEIGYTNTLVEHVMKVAKII